MCVHLNIWISIRECATTSWRFYQLLTSRKHLTRCCNPQLANVNIPFRKTHRGSSRNVKNTRKIL